MLPKVVTPVDDRVVKIADPGVTDPIDGKLAAPADEIFQLASVNDRSAAVVPIPMDPM